MAPFYEAAASYASGETHCNPFFRNRPDPRSQPHRRAEGRWTLSIPALVPALIGFGYFKGMYDANLRASLHDVVKPERKATAVGVMNAIGSPGRRARRG